MVLYHECRVMIYCEPVLDEFAVELAETWDRPPDWKFYQLSESVEKSGLTKQMFQSLQIRFVPTLLYVPFKNAPISLPFFASIATVFLPRMQRKSQFKSKWGPMWQDKSFYKTDYKLPKTTLSHQISHTFLGIWCVGSPKLRFYKKICVFNSVVSGVKNGSFLIAFDSAL